MPALLSAWWESGSQGWHLGSALGLCGNREACLWVLSSTIYYHMTSHFGDQGEGGLSPSLKPLGRNPRLWRKHLSLREAGTGWISEKESPHHPTSAADSHYAARTSIRINKPPFGGLKLFVLLWHLVPVNVSSWIKVFPDSGNKRIKLHSYLDKCEGLCSAQESADWLGLKSQCCW